MQKREFYKALRNLGIFRDTGLCEHRDMLILRPVDDYIRGLVFSASQSPTHFYLHVCILPLIAPSEFFHITLGERIYPKGEAMWDTESSDFLSGLREAIHDKALPFLRSLQNPAAAVLFVRKYLPHPTAFECVFCAQVRDNNFHAAKQTLADFEEYVQSRKARDDDYFNKYENRMKSVIALLERSPAAAQERLDLWREENIRKYSLEKCMG